MHAMPAEPCSHSNPPPPHPPLAPSPGRLSAGSPARRAGAQVYLSLCTGGHALAPAGPAPAVSSFRAMLRQRCRAAYSTTCMQRPPLNTPASPCPIYLTIACMDPRALGCTRTLAPWRQLPPGAPSGRTAPDTLWPPECTRARPGPMTPVDGVQTASHDSCESRFARRTSLAPTLGGRQMPAPDPSHPGRGGGFPRNRNPLTRACSRPCSVSFSRSATSSAPWSWPSSTSSRPFSDTAASTAACSSHCIPSSSRLSASAALRAAVRRATCDVAAAQRSTAQRGFKPARRWLSLPNLPQPVQPP